MKNIKLLWNRIWNLFDYIYYRSVAFYEKYHDSTPEIRGLMVLVTLQICTLLLIFLIIYALTDYLIIKDKVYLVLILAVMIVFQYRYYISTHRYNDFKRKWGKEPKKQRKKHGIFIIVSFILVILLNVAISFIKHNILGQ